MSNIDTQISEAAMDETLQTMLKMRLPQNVTLPFLAYGIFKKGEISFHCIQNYVQQVIDDVELPFRLYVRDGIPIVDSSDTSSRISACQIWFKEGLEETAYRKISELEPEKYYYWQTAEIGGEKSNFLSGKSPTIGSVIAENPIWDSWGDPLFTEIFEIIKPSKISFDITAKGFLQLQMQYLLLWAGIERFASLRYGFRGERVNEKLKKLANSLEYKKALKATLIRKKKFIKREVFSSDSVEKSYVLSAENPVSSIHYYYQVRCNIAHRGKAAIDDAKLVHDCLIDLTNIFKHILETAKTEAHFINH